MDLRAPEFYETSGLPVVGATVEVWDAVEGTPSGTADDSTTTDSNGWWSFTGLTDSPKDVKVTFADAVRWYKGLTRLSLDRMLANAVTAPGVHRNLLTNGGLDIWQRGTGAFTTDAAYTADRWQIDLAGTDTISVSAETTDKKANSKRSAELTFTLGDGAGASRFQQTLKLTDDAFEGLLGKTLSLRLSVKASVASAIRAVIETDGTDGTSTYSSYHTGGGDFEELDVAGVEVPTDATEIKVGVALAKTGTFDVDNAMLVVSPVPVDYDPLHPADDLARCQRYYEVHGGTATKVPAVIGWTDSTSRTVGQWVPFHVQKVVAPTVTKNGTWAVLNCGQPSVDLGGINGYRIQVSNAGAGNVATNPDGTDDTITAEANP